MKKPSSNNRRQKPTFELPLAKRRIIRTRRTCNSSNEKGSEKSIVDDEGKDTFNLGERKGKEEIEKEEEKEEEEEESDTESDDDEAWREISNLTVGCRVAYEFADGTYFGSIRACSVSKEKRGQYEMVKKGRWEVEFDDGDCWELDYADAGKALALFQRIKEEEMKDPRRDEKIDMLINSHFMEKFEILNALPDELKDQFLQVGFAKWNNVFLPVLFLGPYDLSPGPVRDKWMKQFRKAIEDKQKMENFPRIVYWYGESEQDAYSMRGKDQCLSCEEGTRLGLGHIPIPIQEKLDSGGDLSKMERSVLKGLEAMMKDMRIPRMERKIPFEKVLEDYQLVIRGIRLVVEIESKKRLKEKGNMLV